MATKTILKSCDNCIKNDVCKILVSFVGVANEIKFKNDNSYHESVRGEFATKIFNLFAEYCQSYHRDMDK